MLFNADKSNAAIIHSVDTGSKLYSIEDTDILRASSVHFDLRSEQIRLITAGESTLLKVWNVASGVCEQEYSIGHRLSIVCCAVFELNSGEGALAVTGSADGVVVLSDINTGAIIRSLDAQIGAVISLTLVYRPSVGGWAVSVTYLSGAIILWSLATGIRIRTLNGFISDIPLRWGHAIFDSANRCVRAIACGDTSDTAILWNLGADDIVVRLEGGHTGGSIHCVAVNAPDGVLLTGSGDREDPNVYVWDYIHGTRYVMGHLTGHHTDRVSAIAVWKSQRSPDTLVITGEIYMYVYVNTYYI